MADPGRANRDQAGDLTATPGSGSLARAALGGLDAAFARLTRLVFAEQELECYSWARDRGGPFCLGFALSPAEAPTMTTSDAWLPESAGSRFWRIQMSEQSIRLLKTNDADCDPGIDNADHDPGRDDGSLTQDAGYVSNPDAWHELSNASSSILRQKLSRRLSFDASTLKGRQRVAARKLQQAFSRIMAQFGSGTKYAGSNQQLLRAIGRFISEQRKDLPCDYRRDREGRERHWCPPVEDQRSENTCSSHVVSSLLEFLGRKELIARAEAGELNEDTIREAMGGASRLFLHQVATMIATRGKAIDPASQRLKQDELGKGRAISDVLKVLRRYGVPPEDFWPYPGDAGARPALEDQPSAFVFKIAEAFKAERLIRIDHPEDLPMLVPKDAPDPESEEKALLLILVKACLLLYGLPLTAGLLGYPREIAQDSPGGEIPLPDANDEIAIENGHAVLIVGFDESKEVVHPSNSEIRSTGAFLFQNSWGEDWGKDGYGWLPYDYVLGGFVDDVWTLSHATFSNLGDVEETKFFVGDLAAEGDLEPEALKQLKSYLKRARRSRRPPATHEVTFRKNRALTRAIATLGKNALAYDPDVPGLSDENEEMLASGDSGRLLDLYALGNATRPAVGDATRLAALVARLAASEIERRRYFDKPEVLREAGLSVTARAAFRGGRPDAIEQILRGLGGPGGPGGPGRRITDPDEPSNP